MILVDFNLKDVVGHWVKIYYSEMRRLAGDNKPVAKKYNAKVLELLIFHNINKKLGELEDNWDSLEELQRVVELDIIDKEVTIFLLLCILLERNLLLLSSTFYTLS